MLNYVQARLIARDVLRRYFLPEVDAMELAHDAIADVLAKPAYLNPTGIRYGCLHAVERYLARLRPISLESGRAPLFELGAPTFQEDDEEETYCDLLSDGRTEDSLIEALDYATGRVPLPKINKGGRPKGCTGRAVQKTHATTCAYCGEEFLTARPSIARYCPAPKKCRKQAHR